MYLRLELAYNAHEAAQSSGLRRISCPRKKSQAPVGGLVRSA